MLMLTPEQKAVLGNEARIRVVRAGPGTGKTRLFVEAVREHLQSWNNHKAGLAALSFTNVAQNEIADRLGGRLVAPHFVGTLDSFMLRFVVRPFAHVVDASSAGLRLIPSPLDLEMNGPLVKIGPGPKDSVSIFRMRFNQGTGSNLTFRFTDRMGRNATVESAYSEAVLKRKKSVWKDAGLITHSDTHYLAARILESYPQIGSLLTQRFPVILVDELQDTSWFLGRALIELLKVMRLRSLLVGDPDQAIYEFGGANPNIFSVIEALEGAKSFPLTISQRCATRICAVASALSDSGATVFPKDGAFEGRVVMLVHAFDKPAPDPTLIKGVVAIINSDKSAVVLARRNQTLLRLRGAADRAAFPGRSRLARAMDHACVLLQTVQAAKAAAMVSKELYALAFDDEAFSRTKLIGRGIDLRRWKECIYSVLAGAAESKAATWNSWISEVRASMEAELKQIAGKTVSLGALLKKDSADALRSSRTGMASTVSWPMPFSFLSVHQSKGREFHNVVYFQPKPHAQHDPCPSTQWFSAGTEERRIGYVAGTRAENILVLCVHKQTYEALGAKQPGFVNLCEVVLLGRSVTA
jgi:DNA helicase-2/ATP-dependent DNA helicase PcrA